MIHLCLLILCIAFPLHASEISLFPVTAVSAESVNAIEIILPKETYLIPQTIFVGDKGRLVATLGPAFEWAEAFVIQSPQELSVHQDLVIYRIELEKRNNNVRLLIDFIPYAPGSFTLPLFQFPSVISEPLVLGGLEINVASILSPELMVLSDPALPLAVPGTGFIVYGGAGAILLFLIIAIGVIFWLRRYLGPFREKLRRRRLFVSMEQKLKQLRSTENDPFSQIELFALLAGEFREFLSFVTGVDCRVLAPPEFLDLPVVVPGSPGPDYLCSLFRRWDWLRFSGEPMAWDDVSGILDELGSFLAYNKKAEKGP